jgi:uncharacterized protein YdhG (YjbR/CyaY superfamily)
MVKSEAKTVDQYLETLPPDRREAITAVREVILANLPEGYRESMNWGMIGYGIPLERYPNTYNKQPLTLAALAAQKNYMSLYLMTVYGDKETEAWFSKRFEASGKKLDMGKSCVRFRKLDDLPLDLVGEVIRRWSVDEYIAHYEQVHVKR